MGPQKDKGSYWGYEEGGNVRLQSIQSFQRTTHNTTQQGYVKDRQKGSSEAIKQTV